MHIQYRYEGSLGVTMYEKSFVYFNIPAFIVTILLIITAIYSAFRSRKIWLAVAKATGRNIEPPVQRVVKHIIVVSDKSHVGEVVKVAKRSKK